MTRFKGLNAFFFFQAEDGIRDLIVTGVQTCALPICRRTLARQEKSCFRGIQQTSDGRQRSATKRSIFGETDREGFRLDSSSTIFVYSLFARLPLYSAGPGTGAQFRSEVRPRYGARFRGILLRKARGDQVMARILQNKAFFGGIHRGMDGPFYWMPSHTFVGPSAHTHLVHQVLYRLATAADAQ